MQKKIKTSGFFFCYKNITSVTRGMTQDSTFDKAHVRCTVCVTTGTFLFLRFLVSHKTNMRVYIIGWFFQREVSSFS